MRSEASSLSFEPIVLRIVTASSRAEPAWNVDTDAPAQLGGDRNASRQQKRLSLPLAFAQHHCPNVLHEPRQDADLFLGHGLSLVGRAEVERRSQEVQFHPVH